MLPKDPVFTVINNHRLPVNRKGIPIKTFLKTYYEDYIENINSAIKNLEDKFLSKEFYEKLKSHLPIIKDLTRDILDIYDYLDSSDMVETSKKVDCLLDNIKGYLYTKKNINPDFYRIRPDNLNYTRKDLFHIPLTKRQYIKPYRYSIAGYPCLYLSDSKELCWFECGMPKEFSVSKFRFEPDKGRKLKLIDFSIQPVDLISSIPIWYYNYKEDKDKIDDYLINYLITHPLRTACSIIVSNKSLPFIEEYTFPQLLLVWIRQYDYFDGIAYTSSSAIEAAHEWNSYNVVFPARDIENGYCKKLSKMFKISKPVKVNLREQLIRYNDKINTIKEFVEYLENKIKKGELYYLYREIVSLCKSFLLIFNELRFGNYSNPELLNQVMDTIDLFSYLIVKNQEHFEGKAILEASSNHIAIDSDEVKKRFADIINQFKSEVHPILFEFRDYVNIIRCNTSFKEDSLEYISGNS